MTSSFALATFLMGVAGGPHCIAMCGAACAYIQRHQRTHTQFATFLAGRLLGYASMGAIAAYSVKSLAWASEQTAALHPLWTFFHVFVLLWGLVLLLFAKQPIWADQLGRSIWKHLRIVAGASKGVFLLGFFWVFMPCGLLYSALIVASLQANPLNGAISMATFAIGSSFSLFIGPTLWQKLRGMQWMNDGMSMRISGLLLCIISGIAIWMDVVHKVKVWCT